MKAKKCDHCGKSPEQWYSFGNTCWSCYKKLAEAEERVPPVSLMYPIDPVTGLVLDRPVLIQQPEEPAP